MSSPPSIHLTLGPLLAGSMSAVGLSAIVGFQTFLYFRIYPQDKMRYKLLVGWVWLVDAAHTLFICLTVWDFAISHFGDQEHLTVIPMWYPVLFLLHWQLEFPDDLQAHALMAFTATFSANMKVLHLANLQKYTVFCLNPVKWRFTKSPVSKGNWCLVVPIVMLCFARITCGLAPVYGEIKYKLWATIVRAMSFITSAITDIVISSARYYYLRRLNQGYFQTKEVLDTVLVFTINDGMLTSAVAVVIMSCTLAMHTNFVWIGIYFNFAKLFANSILATLNLRNWYRQMHRPMGITLTRDPHLRNTIHIEVDRSHLPTSPRAEALPPQDADSGVMDPDLEVQVEKQIEYHVEMDKYSAMAGVPKTVDLKV
ncbi:hypothetical protein FB45DRAFT_1024879 [Roridomyces roridus]|uniref:DUF6534 domain-containing protein n=1 Tax=Roridomyces roridus TaxID=1738132 RepID=A0AAD7FQ93_9AGAR|nr:hypothetical protein FB45DRAFT_1024879 [Roridomyces roridus]